MPKVVSRSAVSASTDAHPTASSAAALRVYYCLCGEFILVIDKSLSSLPRRQTDNAIIVRSQDSNDQKARVFKLNAKYADPILLERHVIFASIVHLPGYQHTPPPAKSSPFIYILSGALTQMQGQLPQDAFDGENN
ncbi:hypothetical protein CCMSSC00406_0001418 [Pleurotus cornucopiae]|uniref:Uncharacterized protein n=1 Tax=Pleurotus cornucopiae TaxID=5321 RepID=A0ACB7ILE0_PLECO|nr:hypothetical protein CCMSSC00406_0001418 [Pleurotus cornucopiae]